MSRLDGAKDHAYIVSMQLKEGQVIHFLSVLVTEVGRILTDEVPS